MERDVTCSFITGTHSEKDGEKGERKINSKSKDGRRYNFRHDWKLPIKEKGRALLL